jgi:hypothetical protein
MQQEVTGMDVPGRTLAVAAGLIAEALDGEVLS